MKEHFLFRLHLSRIARLVCSPAKFCFRFISTSRPLDHSTPSSLPTPSTHTKTAQNRPKPPQTPHPQRTNGGLHRRRLAERRGVLCPSGRVGARGAERLRTVRRTVQRSVQRGTRARWAALCFMRMFGAWWKKDVEGKVWVRKILSY